jgi:hypothetical protein
VTDTRGLFVNEEVAKFFLRGVTPETADERWGKATEKERKHAREKSRVRLNQLVRNGRLIRYDPVHFGVGTKPAVVFGSPQVKTKRTWVAHDAHLWRYLRTIRNARHMLVGFDCDPETREDAFGTFSNGLTARIEMDMDTESLAEIGARLDVLVKKPEMVLFLTLSKTRLGRLKAKAAEHAICDRVALGLWGEMTSSAEHVWEDCNGHRNALYPAGG